MDPLRIGVVAIQGDVREHISALGRASESLGIPVKAVSVRRERELDGLSGIILPGGESTTISKLLVRFGLDVAIRRMVRAGTPIMGTCAGAVLLASRGDEEVEKTGTKLLELMPYAVMRNSFGRQKDSFEADLDIVGLDSPFHAVFIRAPLITDAWGDAEVLARFRDDIVMVKSENRLALSFHPELTDDTRIHAMFLNMCLNYSSQP